MQSTNVYAFGKSILKCYHIHATAFALSNRKSDHYQHNIVSTILSITVGTYYHAREEF